MSAENPYSTPIHLYFKGFPEGEEGGYRLNDSEILSIEDLSSYLNDAESALKNKSSNSKGLPISIVIEGTQSGHWIEKISGEGRIIITSSSDKPVDEGGFAGYDNLGNSFSHHFYGFINSEDIEVAFAEVGYEIFKFYKHTQIPVMDADGDGFGTTNFDRYEASGKSIYYMGPGNFRPEIRLTMPDKAINNQAEEENTLWVIAEDPQDEMEGVYCLIEGPVGNKNLIRLNYQTGSLYSVNYEFSHKGLYYLLFYALNKAGMISEPKQAFINVLNDNLNSSEPDSNIDNIPIVLVPSITSAIIADGNCCIWVGTLFLGLYHFNINENKRTIFNKNNSILPSNSISDIVSDSKGGFLVGTTNGLVHIDDGGKWGLINKDNSVLPSNYITDIASNEDASFWIGTDNGLVQLKNGDQWTIFNMDNSSIRGNTINSVVSDGNCGVWAITNNKSTNDINLINIDSAGNIKIVDSNNNSFNGIPRTLLNSINKGLWVVTDKSIDYLDNNGKWKNYYTYNINTAETDEFFPIPIPINSIFSGKDSSLWLGGFDAGLSYLGSDGSLFSYGNTNSLINQAVTSCLFDDVGGMWVGTIDGKIIYHSALGIIKQIKSGSADIKVSWFLNRSPLEEFNVIYFELQRSLSKDGIYETVLDSSDNPIRFYTDYTHCPNPRVDNCSPAVQGHTPSTNGFGDSMIKGYSLNVPIIDPEWLEGLPRYYRLSAVVDKGNRLVRVANNNEAVLIYPEVEEKPRVQLILDCNAIAMEPNQKAEITVFVSSLDLFRGDVSLAIASGADNTNTIADNIKVTLESDTISLKSGEIKPVILKINSVSENSSSNIGVVDSTIKIVPKIESGYSGKSASLNILVNDSTTPMIALSIANKTKRTRVLDALTISGNVIPAQAGQKVTISGNNIKESDEYATFTTDDNGYFQGFVTPIHAGLLTLTAQSKGITSNTAEIFILPAKTNIALSSNVNQSTTKDDKLIVQGIISPISETITDIKLNISYIDLTEPEPIADPTTPNKSKKSDSEEDAAIPFIGRVPIDEQGRFSKEITIPVKKGIINVKASLPETSDYLSINTKLVIPIGQPVGEGIIVVSESGGGSSQDAGNSMNDADFQTISKSLGSYVYNALKSRNIPVERIKYLGLGGDKIIADFKINDSLASENFGKTNKANLHNALTNWAASLFSTDDPYKTPLNIYLIGKVEDDNSFRLNDNEVLTADDLAQYLNEAEEIIKTNSKDNYSEYKGFPVTIVLEGTQSGKWIEKIAGNGRIILTSSSDKGLDEGGFAGYDNLGGSSFSRYFYQFINYGYDIEGSFAEASYEILKFYRHKQRPVMDADGDGIGTTNYDSYEASGKFIEYRPSGNLRPQIITTNPDRTIKRRIGVSSDESSAGSVSHFDDPILWAIAADPEEEMDGVFCSITDPSNKTVNIEMKRKFDNQNVYEIDLSQTYPNLATGCYHAVYYAKDKAGNVSLPEQKHLNVISSNADQGGGGVPNPPQFTISVDDDSSMAAVSWSEVANADGYKLFYCPYPDCPPADIGEIDMGNKREITFDGKGFAFYGAVKAYNSNGFSGWSNVEFFNLR